MKFNPRFRSDPFMLPWFPKTRVLTPAKRSCRTELFPSCESEVTHFVAELCGPASRSKSESRKKESRRVESSQFEYQSKVG